LFFPGGGIGQPGVDKQLVAIEEAAIKREKELEKLRSKQIREQAILNRLKRISLVLIQKEARFDLNRIQLAAALQGKLTDEERQRVEELLKIEDIKQAIAEKDVDKAEKLLDELNKLRFETEALAESLLDLEAGNPFSKWPGYFYVAKKNIQDLFDSLAKQQLLLNELTSGIAAGRAKANQSVLDAKTDRTTAYAVAAGRTREEAERATREAAEAAARAAKALLEAQNEAERVAAQEGIRAAEEAARAAQLLTETIAVADFATALAAESEANEYLGQSMDAAFFAGIIPNVEINVNVEGNVTTAEDLAEVITDIQYNYQRTGKGILLSSRAI
jgi:hypothetical protein